VYLHSPTTTGGSLVAGAFLIAVLWDAVPHATLLTWGAALAIYQAFRIYGYRRYLAANPDASQSRSWGRQYILNTTIAGCLWGSTGILFYVPDSTLSQVYLCLVLFGVASLTIPTLSLFAPAFYPWSCWCSCPSSCARSRRGNGSRSRSRSRWSSRWSCR